MRRRRWWRNLAAMLVGRGGFVVHLPKPTVERVGEVLKIGGFTYRMVYVVAGGSGLLAEWVAQHTVRATEGIPVAAAAGLLMEYWTPEKEGPAWMLVSRNEPNVAQNFMNTARLYTVEM